MKYCGIDLHSNKFTCCTIFEDGHKEKATYVVSLASIKEFTTILDKNTSVIIEASTNTFKFVEAI